MKTISHIQKLLTLGALLLAVGASAALPFIFWLEQPKRSNPHDRKSKLFFPTETPVPPPATPTFTRTLTLTYSVTQTYSVTPTFSVSPTDTPYAGSATNTFTDSPTPT